jgi:translation initiation factor RLI1
MYEVKLNIEEQYLSMLLKYLDTLQSVHIEKIIKKREQKNGLSKNEILLKTLPLNDPLRQVIKPIRKGVTLQQILAEQNYTKTNWTRVDEIAQNLDIQEPLEELLTQLKE